MTSSRDVCDIFLFNTMNHALLPVHTPPLTLEFNSPVERSQPDVIRHSESFINSLKEASEDAPTPTLVTSLLANREHSNLPTIYVTDEGTNGSAVEFPLSDIDEEDDEDERSVISSVMTMMRDSHPELKYADESVPEGLQSLAPPPAGSKSSEGSRRGDAGSSHSDDDVSGLFFDEADDEDDSELEDEKEKESDVTKTIFAPADHVRSNQVRVQQIPASGIAATSTATAVAAQQQRLQNFSNGKAPVNRDSPNLVPKPLTLTAVLKHLRRGSRETGLGLPTAGTVPGQSFGSSSILKNNNIITRNSIISSNIVATTTLSVCNNNNNNNHNNAHHSNSLQVPGTSPPVSRRGRRKSSIFSNVLRRVSIHRRDSAPSGRLGLFVFDPQGAACADPEAVGEGESDVDDEGEREGGGDGGEDEGGEEVTPRGPEGEGDGCEDGENGRTTEKKDEAEVTLRHKPKSQLSLLIENLCVVLSGLYGILLVVLGLVIPLTEIFANQKDHRFEIFYLYLYGISIIFLSYVYLYLLRRNRLRTELVTRTLSRSMSWTRNWAKSWMPDNNQQRSSRRKRMVSLDETNHHTGTFYLRLGVLGFGIGSMIHSGLTFGKFYGSITDGQCVRGAELMLKPLFHLGFTFFQLYFVFMNSKMCIHRYKILARFGLMHMAATNICVWMRSIVVETLHEIHHSHHLEDHAGEDHASDHGDAVEGGPDPHHPRLEPHTQGYDPSEGDHRSLGHGNLSLVTIGRKLLAAAAAGNESVRGLLESTCSWNNMMGSAVDKAGPYLYPCTIEYSLMCAGILYVMWNNVGSRPRRRPVSQVEEDESDRKVQRMSVDCTGSSRGLFTGIFLTVAAIISIIAFYVMVEQPKLEEQALLLTHLSETFIYLLTLFAIFMACLKMRQLHFHADHASDMEEVLIIIAYTGLLMFNMFSVIAATLSPGEGAALTIISNLTMMIQAAVQTIFMLAGDRLSAKSQLQERKKPGREYVTFLLLCNFAMWIINTFETQKPEHNPIQVHFYGPEAWSIFSHISVPLGIYYRFHSTVCLSNIWKNAWKLRKHSHSSHGAASHH